MSLFQPSVLKKYLSQQDSDQVLKAYKKYVKYFHNITIQENIRNSKEEQFQEGFLRELFVDILGYTLNPTPKFNLTTELKNIKGAKKVDGAILKDGNALGVIELKGTNTKDLESIRQQAFDYKANQTGCIYVITSNFEKLRFYINNAVDYEEFNLFTLTHAEFEIFYLCLAKENILANKPLSIKEASVVEEENITKKFYSDYSVFKRELYRDLVKQNRSNILLNDLPEKTTKLILFQKSQKLIDRFLFILFAEDRGLLAPNSINTVLKEWKALADLDVEMPLYDRYKQYFGYLDTGRKGTDKKEEIFAYNGGLFQPDAILDAVMIDNEMLYRHTLKLSTYDFESQVDVNILGHIFEHSLNEIESVNAEIEGTDFDKQKTKRKKDGVFYTPKYITKYIVDNTIGKLCTEKKQELGIIDEEYAKGRKNRHEATILKLDQQLKDYREWLLELTICDPACGSGAFLNQALDFLIKEHAYLDELNKQLFGGFFVFPDIENQILEHNIYGVDLNEESIEIAKLSLWLRTAQPKRKLTSLNNNIKCGNSLIDSKAIAGDKAFNWKEQFPEVFAKGGFDVIIGNPPYLRVQGLKEHYFEQSKYYEMKFQSATGNYDIYALFMERCFHLINDKGIISFILPHKFLVTDFGVGIRKFFKENTAVENIIHFNSHIVFKEAATYTCIIDLTKSHKDNIYFKKIKPSELLAYSDFESMKYDLLSESNWDLQGSSINNIIENLKKQPHTVADVFDKIFVGLQTSLDSVFVFKGKENGKTLKVYDEKLGTYFEIEKAMTKPFIKGNEISKYKNLNNISYVIFPYVVGIDGKATPMKFDLIENHFPLTAKYLRQQEKLLRGREKGKFDNNNDWFLFGRKQGMTGVELPKIMTQEISLGCNMTYDEIGEYYHPTTIYSFVKSPKFEVDEKYYLGILNSKVMWFFLKNTGTELGGGYFRFKTNYLKPFPLPSISKDAHIMIDLVNEILSLNKNYQSISFKFITYYSGQYQLEKLTKKLENWHELNFADFITELNKAIKIAGQTPLTKKDEFEWLDLFEENKTKAQVLKSQIETSQKAIDKMVYELYGLSEEEIGFVDKQ
jgi:type I restriction-modification system DNA methylase subunit